MKKTLSTLFLLFLVSLPMFAAAQDGSWTNQSTGQNSAQGVPRNLALTVSGSTLTGTLDGVAIANGGISGNVFWFTVTRNGVKYSYKGTVSGTQMTLSQYLIQATAYSFTRTGS